jgi:toxin ParE1/3/4
VKYSLTRQADRHLSDIYLYTAKTFGRAQADSYLQAFAATFRLLAENPQMGRAADEVRPGLRRHEHAGHVIFYRGTGKRLLIIGVIHNRRRPEFGLD